MKKFKKSTAIVLISILSVLLVVGFLFSYIPMTVGANTFVSFSGSMSVSSDVTGGMYGEYNIVTENPSQSDLVDSMLQIKDVFEENGYRNVNVYALGTEKIRVEVSYPRGSRTFAETYSQLAMVGTGAFALSSTNSLTSDEAIVMYGSDCVSNIRVYTNNQITYMSIEFNDAGEELYRQICEEGEEGGSSSIYMFLGDYSQQISISDGEQDYSNLTVSNTDYANLIQLEQNIKLGCMKVELDADTALINTMSASLSAGESASTPEIASFMSSTTYVVVISAIAVILVLGLAIFAVRFGLFAILIVISLLFNSYLFVILMTLMPSIELGLSGFAALALGIGLIYTYTYNYVNQVKYEYNQGKSIAASLQHAYKKTLPNTLIGNIMLFLMSLVVFAFAFGELISSTIIFAICTALSLFTNLLFIPLLIKICISFEGAGRKLFMLKKRSEKAEKILVDDSDITISKEAK